MPEQRVSKSRFKAKALEYFREVQRTGRPIVITEHRVPVLKVVPFAEDPAAALRVLRDTVVKYEAPTEPVGEGEWESVR